MPRSWTSPVVFPGCLGLSERFPSHHSPGSRDTGNSQFIPAAVKWFFLRRDFQKKKTFSSTDKALCKGGMFTLGTIRFFSLLLNVVICLLLKGMVSGSHHILS